MKRLFTAAAILLVVVGLAACQPAEPEVVVETVVVEKEGETVIETVEVTKELDVITVQLSWLKDAQFAGFFAADQLGYYEDAGIQVNFLAGGSGVDPHTMIRQNPDMVGIGSGGGIITAVSRGAPIVAVGVINQTHPNGFLLLEEGDIETFEDFEGHTIGVLPEGEYYLDAIIAYYGMDKTEMEVIRTGYDPSPLLNGQVDAIMAWISNQPLAIEKAGKEWDFLLTNSVPGLKFYSTVMIVNQKFVDENPELLQRFICASMQGWDYVFDNTEEVAQWIVDIYLPGADYETEVWMLERMNDLNKSEDTLENGLGWMSTEVWETGANSLLTYEQIETMPDIDQMTTNQFIEACPVYR